MPDGCAVEHFEADVQPIFTASCAITGCHAGPAPAGALVLADGFSWSALSKTSSWCAPDKLVEPYDPSRSALWLTMTATTCGPRHPTSMSAADLETIRCWIEEGAPP